VRRIEEEEEGARLRFGNMVVEETAESGMFDKMRIFNIDDYKKDQCWICQSGSAKWDLWRSCQHIFCVTCSEEMMMRQMPCPLCRTKSNRVLRVPQRSMSHEFQPLMYGHASLKTLKSAAKLGRELSPTREVAER
jgi:hypothetical protein